MGPKTLYTPTREHVLFVWQLLTNYTTRIYDVCMSHGLNGDAEGTNIANQVCQYIAPDRMDALLQSSNADFVYISTLRANRDWFINKIHDLLIQINQSSIGNKTMSNSNQTHQEPIQKQPETTNTQIQNNIKLRRLTSISIELTNLLENIFILRETPYMEHNRSIRPTSMIPSQSQIGIFNRDLSQRQAELTRSQYSSDENPYAKMSFTADQLDQADKKIMELVQILFPYSEQTPST